MHYFTTNAFDASDNFIEAISEVSIQLNIMKGVWCAVPLA